MQRRRGRMSSAVQHARPAPAWKAAYLRGVRLSRQRRVAGLTFPTGNKRAAFRARPHGGSRYWLICRGAGKLRVPAWSARGAAGSWPGLRWVPVGWGEVRVVRRRLVRRGAALLCPAHGDSSVCPSVIPRARSAPGAACAPFRRLPFAIP